MRFREPGLYKVILRSDKPEAKNFMHWITHEVLPSIRKHGAYITTQKMEELMQNPETRIKLIQTLQQERQEKRTYLGASMIGDECARKVQLQFLGKEEEVSAQTLRTFDIGHALEDIVAQWLVIAGLDLKTRDENGQQFGFSVASSKIQGHVDGIIVGASETIPGLRFPALWECKTLNESSWKDTMKRGVLISKPLYYAQIQLYMAYMNLENCLFTALNKNDSQLYFEWVQFDT